MIVCDGELTLQMLYYEFKLLTGAPKNRNCGFRVCERARLSGEDWQMGGGRKMDRVCGRRRSRRTLRGKGE